MVSLDDLPVSDETRVEARAWSRRWEQLAWDERAAEASVAGMKSDPAEPVSDEAWASLERDGRAVWQRLQDDLGSEWLLEWAYP
jgi:hypothetical protein